MTKNCVTLGFFTLIWSNNYFGDIISNFELCQDSCGKKIMLEFCTTAVQLRAV